MKLKSLLLAGVFSILGALSLKAQYIPPHARVDIVKLGKFQRPGELAEPTLTRWDKINDNFILLDTAMQRIVITGGGNIPTSLSVGSRTPTTFGINSDGGVNDVVLLPANATQAGLLTSDMLSDIQANNAKVSNISTFLNVGTRTTTTFQILSDGTGLVLPTASSSYAGLLSSELYDNIITNNAKIGLALGGVSPGHLFAVNSPVFAGVPTYNGSEFYWSLINESNLNATNAPTNGQVLSYGGSNNFTWVDASAGGLTPNSILATHFNAGNSASSYTLPVYVGGAQDFLWSKVDQRSMNFTNTPTTGQIISYGGSDQFTWIDAAAAGHWQKTGTSLSPVTSGDDIHLTDNTERLLFGDNDTYLYEHSDDQLRAYTGGALNLQLGTNSNWNNAHWVPYTTNAFDLGTSSYFWRYGYLNRMYLQDVNTHIGVDASNNLTFTDANSGTQTLADLMSGGSGPSGSAVGFYATCESNSTYPVVNGHWRIVDAGIWNSEVWDSGNTFDLATGCFTAPEDGVYMFQGLITIGNTNVDDGRIIAAIIVNPSVTSGQLPSGETQSALFGRGTVPTGNWGGYGGTVEYELSAGDKVYMSNYITTGGSYGSNFDGYMHFGARKIDSGTGGTGGGTGDVNATGAPADNQLAVWVNDHVIEGSNNLTFDGTTFNLNGVASFNNNIDVNGNITVNGTVDGIDIATDVAANTAKIGLGTDMVQADHLWASNAATTYTLPIYVAGLTDFYWDKIDDRHMKFTNSPASGQVVSYGGSNNFTWVDQTGGGSGSSTFTGLTDTPGDYAGAAGRVVSVNGGADGLEYTETQDASTTVELLNDTRGFMTYGWFGGASAGDPGGIWHVARNKIAVIDNIVIVAEGYTAPCSFNIRWNDTKNNSGATNALGSDYNLYSNTQETTITSITNRSIPSGSIVWAEIVSGTAPDVFYVQINGHWANN